MTYFALDKLIQANVKKTEVRDWHTRNPGSATEIFQPLLSRNVELINS